MTTPTVSSPPDQLVGMGDGYVDVPVTLSAPGQSTVTVSYATANATASAGTSCDNEYVAASGTLTFTPGQTTQTVRVGLNNCKITGTYFFYFNLSSPVGATIVRPQSVIDIVGDAAGSGTPQLDARAATVDASAGSVLVPVLLNGTTGQASTSTVTVDYATADGSAKAGTDYTSTSSTLTFVPGETVQNVSVPILDPSGSKPTRSFTLTLSNPTNATLGQVTATVTIGASGAGAVTTPTVSSPPDQLVGMGDGYVDVPVTLSAPGQLDSHRLVRHGQRHGVGRHLVRQRIRRGVGDLDLHARADHPDGAGGPQQLQDHRHLFLLLQPVLARGRDHPCGPRV